MSWSQSYVSHCRVLPPGELNDMNPEQRFTLQGAATWWIQCHVIPEPRVIAVCCHLANSMSWSQSHVSHCRVLPPGEFNYMSSQSHVLHCRVLTPSDFNVMIPEPHWKSFFAVFIFGFPNAVWASANGGFRIVSYTLVLHQLGQSHINNTRKNISQYNMY